MQPLLEAAAFFITEGNVPGLRERSKARTAETDEGSSTTGWQPSTSACEARARRIYLQSLRSEVGKRSRLNGAQIEPQRFQEKPRGVQPAAKLCELDWGLMRVNFTIPLVVPSLKNQKRLGRGRMFDDAEVKAFKRDFPLLVPKEYRGLGMGSRKKLLALTVFLVHKDWRRDADIEIIPDCLQAAGVISNDRWIRVKHVYACVVDKKRPRAEITIDEL